jgi:hypothetical protein
MTDLLFNILSNIGHYEIDIIYGVVKVVAMIMGILFILFILGSSE